MWHSEESTEQQEIPWLLELSRLGSGVAIGEAKGLAYGWWWRRRRWVDQLETSVKKNERRVVDGEIIVAQEREKD